MNWVSRKKDWLAAVVFVVANWTLIDLGAVEPTHEHTGVLAPYSGPPPEIELSGRDLESLAKETPVYKTLTAQGANRGAVVFRVNAPPDIVWSVIRDFESYPRWINNLKEAYTYRREGGNIYVRFLANHWLAGETMWYVRHNYPTNDRNWGTWTLDYDHRSDFEDSVGFWLVEAVPDRPDKSTLTYSATLKLRIYLPAFIRSSLTKKTLKEATLWVKAQAEARAK